MQLVILHHHLNSGGVTRVIQNHLLALAKAATAPNRVVLLHGGRAVGWPPEELHGPHTFDLECYAVEGLDYDDSAGPATTELAQTILSTLQSLNCSPSDTLLHWHNHSLGKNAATPLAVQYLAERGYHILLQIHDFAEDFRPENYRRLAAALVGGEVLKLPEKLYPQAPHLHYATLNERDYQVLLQAGLSESRLHLLPNPTASPPNMERDKTAREIVRQQLNVPANSILLTYPVRGIRRKNLGELLLWSAATKECFFHVSLTPESPVEHAAFKDWSEFATQLRLPCQLGRPTEADFTYEQLLEASDALVTTSVAEGFGMVFLETWLMGKRLLGRNLPEITSDFSTVGLDLGELYSSVLIPTTWIEQTRYEKQMELIVSQLYSDFGLKAIKPTELRRQLRKFLDLGTIDFAYLPICIQRSVIERVHESAKDGKELLELNPKLRMPATDTNNLIETNTEVVKNNYSLAKLGENLTSIYRNLSSAPTEKSIGSLSQGEAVLDSFLQLDRLHPVRVES